MKKILPICLSVLILFTGCCTFRPIDDNIAYGAHEKKISAIEIDESDDTVSTIFLVGIIIAIGVVIYLTYDNLKKSK
jgi:hypothetical protein